LGTEPLGGGANVPFDDVVPQHHADLLAIGKVLRQGERIGDAPLALLVGVIDVCKTEVLPIT
jgi:hypothetical protein